MFAIVNSTVINSFIAESVYICNVLLDCISESHMVPIF